MLSTRNELLEKIRLGKDHFLELKEVRFAGDRVRGPSQDDLADELAAFANGLGGVMLLGVHDKTCEVTGIPLQRLDAVEALVRQACQDSMTPAGTPIIERMNLPDAEGGEQAVLRIEVPPSLFIHQSAGGYFHRIGSSKRPIPPEHLARLFQQRSQSRLIRFDETPVPRAEIVDLDDSLWKRFASPRSNEDPERLLSKLAMATRDHEGALRPSVAGVLLGCREPQRFLPNSFIQAVAYRGTRIAQGDHPVYQLDAQDTTGPLDRQIADAYRFVRRNMSVAAIKSSSGGRTDIPQYDMLAIFEAITNAIAHRDYSMAGSKIRLRMFDDRLELYTPGMLVNSMTPDSLPYRQAARNEAITSLLARCPVDSSELQNHRTHIMDKRGEGVPIILSRSEELSGIVPEYCMLDSSELLLTIRAATAPS